jgi:hypothetical protein
MLFIAIRIFPFFHFLQIQWQKSKSPALNATGNLAPTIVGLVPAGIRGILSIQVAGAPPAGRFGNIPNASLQRKAVASNGRCTLNGIAISING